MVDCLPKVMCFAIYIHEHLVQMSMPIGVAVHLLDTFSADLGCENRTEPVPPTPNRLVAHVGTAPVQQIFNISLE